MESATLNPNEAFELKHIRGIPYYVQRGIVFTFELSREEPGKPSASSIPLGTYLTESDTIAYSPDWRERVQSRLGAFRESLQPMERNLVRQHLSKPQKSRKTPRNLRKGAATKRTKVPEHQ